MKKTWSLTLLVLILALGLFLRLYHINEKSLWLDEGISYYNSSAESYAGVWEKTAQLDQSPPFYYFVMHSYLEIFGENEFGFRFVSVVIGVLTIYFLFLLFSYSYNPETGLFAAFLLAINPFHIGYSNEARMYILLCLLVVSSLYLLFKAMRTEKNSYLFWGLFSLNCLAGLYTHNFYFFVLLGQFFVFLMLLFEGENRLKKFFLGLFCAVIVALFYLPWLFELIEQLQVSRYWMGENSILDIKEYLKDFAADNKSALIIMGILALYGGVWHVFSKKANLKNKNKTSSIALGLFLGISFFTPLLYSLFFEPILKIRYVIYVLPIVLGFSALGIYTIRRFAWYLSVPVLLLFMYLWMPHHESPFPLEVGADFRTLAEVVKKYPAPLLVHTPSSAHVINFYLDGKGMVFPYPNSDDLRDYEIDEDSKRDFLNYISRFESFYLAVSHSHESEVDQLVEWSKSTCKHERKIEIELIDLSYFKDCKS